MERFTILGPDFSYFVRSLVIMCRYKGLNYHTSMEYKGQAIKKDQALHLSLHPFGKFPILSHGDFLLRESTSIARYLDTFDGPELFFGDSQQKSEIDSWANCIAIYLEKAVMRDVVIEVFMPKGDDNQIRTGLVTENLAETRYVLKQFSEQLGTNGYIAGERFSAADALLIPILDYADHLSEPFTLLGDGSNLKSYIERMRQLPQCEGILGIPIRQ